MSATASPRRMLFRLTEPTHRPSPGRLPAKKAAQAFGLGVPWRWSLSRGELARG